MTTVAWRETVRDVALRRRLLVSGCPVPLELIYATQSVRFGPLTPWVRSQLGNGVMWRTSQAQHISEGDSITETAVATGISSKAVLYTLTRFEADENIGITEFHYGN